MKFKSKLNFLDFVLVFQGLVDYDGDSDEEMDEEEEEDDDERDSAPQQKKARLA